MPRRERPRPRSRRARVRRLRAAVLLVVVAVIAAALGKQLQASASSTALSPPTRASPVDVVRSAPRSPRSRPVRPGTTTRRPGSREALGEADGAVPDGATVFDDELPGVANLDPALRGALRRAATDAAADGFAFVVDSGWRSAEYQARLLREAVAEHGSAAEAARWVATPDTSAHVSGDAVDIGPDDATAWLSRYGAAYGLCRIYGNEPWHFERRPDAVDDGCPSMYADPTHDPRMRR